MTRYRKKPVEIEAKSYGGDGARPTTGWATLAEWCGGRLIRSDDGSGRVYGIAIDTLEGVMIAGPDDYIVRGVQGEFYPVKPDIFKATYEVAE